MGYLRQPRQNPEPIVIGSLTMPRGINFPSPNPFNDVFVCSNLRSAIPISFNVDLNRTSTDLLVSTRTQSNFLLATVALITRASLCGYNTPSPSSSVHMICICLVFARLAVRVLKNTSFLDLLEFSATVGPPVITLTTGCLHLVLLVFWSTTRGWSAAEWALLIKSSKYRFLTKSLTWFLRSLNLQLGFWGPDTRL